MRWSLRYQLLLPLFLLLLGIAGITAWTALDAAERARQQIEEDVRNVASVFGETNFPLNRHILAHMKRLSGADFVLIDKNDFPPSDSDGPPTTLPIGHVELPPVEVTAADWQTLRLGPPVVVEGHTYLCSGIELRPGRTLYILYPETVWRDARWEAMRPPLVLGLVGGIASLTLALAVSQRLGRRIRALERRTRQIASGDFSPMPLPKRNDELRDLSQSVNDMAQQLAQLQETVRQTERLRLLGQVSGGLAHQLRNGVTGARLAVQLHERACNGDADAESLDVALRQLSLVEATLKRFLDLGRTEELHREACNLCSILDEVVTLLQPQCRHAHTELRWQPPTTTSMVHGDPARLRHLFLNVIGNAMEAAGPEGWVEVKLSHSTNGKCVVTVTDSGPGPPAEIANRLFQPFVTGKREGVGLGLAVARQDAEAHGGRIDWCREPDRTRFQIEIPTA
ncbi:MAG: HAMP domain-containing histidine kinase [Gemmataceae bacterium]|nr:HAMP domain-containing histidine kinase [Gemmataceae bacterium]